MGIHPVEATAVLGSTVGSRSEGTSKRARHWACSAVLALLWGQIAWEGYHRWVESGSAITLGLVVYSSILVAVTIGRRPSISTSARAGDWVIALLTVGLAAMFRPGEWHNPVAQTFGSGLQVLGLSLMVGGLLSLGRSFGIVAANRGVKSSGLYAWVRHPLYASEIVFFSGFVVAQLSPRNLLVFSGVVCGFIVRAWVEERHLGQVPAYQAYLRAVRYRFVPGLF